MTAIIQPRQPKGAVRWRDVCLALVLVGATFLAYLPVLHGEFLLDDEVHVTRPELRSLGGLARIWTEIGATQQYYPVLHTAFWLEHRAWGDAVLGYHVINVLLHASAALLLVALVRRLSLPGGWLAGFGFALHPVCVESVAWISEQKNTLSAVFCLGAALSFLRFESTRGRITYVIASTLFVLALLTKTATAMLPLVLLILIWWRRGGVSGRRDILPLMPWLIVALGAGVITITVERALIAGIEAQVSLPWDERITIAGRAAWFYFAKLIWPANLSFFYERWPNPAGNWWPVGSALGVATFFVCAAMVRRTRGPLATLLAFVALLFPVLGFIDVQWFVFSYVADHFQYLACIAIITGLSTVSASLVPRIPCVARNVVLTAAVTLVVTLGLLSRRHSATFESNVRLYANAARCAPGSAVAHNHLGLSLARIPGRMFEAIAAYETALRINPDAAEVHANLATALQKLGRETDAMAHLETALRLKPSLGSARRNLAAAYFDLGKIAAAKPDQLEVAIQHYESATRLDPAFAEAHFNLGNALLRDPRRRANAIASFEAALRLKPDFAEAHTNLGTAIATLPGRLPEAIAHFEAALRANPDFVPARNNLRQAQRVLSETRGEVR